MTDRGAGATTSAAQPDTAPRQTIRAAVLVAVMTLIGVAALVLGLVYAAQAALGVDRVQTVALRMGGLTTWTESGLIPEVQGFDDGNIPSGHGLFPSQWVGGTPFPVYRTGGLVTELFQADPLTSVEADAPFWALLVGGGLIILVLIPVVRSYAAAQPFTPGTARRVGLAAAITLTAWLLATLLPFHAASRVLARHLYAGPKVPELWLAPHFQTTWWPLLIVLLLTGLALASRRGERLAAETDGLV